MIVYFHNHYWEKREGERNHNFIFTPLSSIKQMALIKLHKKLMLSQ